MAAVIPSRAWKRLTKPRFLFVYPLILALFLSAHVSERSLRAGVVLLVLGEWLRMWANGHVGHRKVNWTRKAPGAQQIGRLITSGPYAYVRHPLYLGTLLLGAGFCLMIHSMWVSGAAFAGFLLTYRKKIAQEEQLLADQYPEEFARYRAAVPQLLPRWSRYAAHDGRWEWRGVAASKEWKTALWVIVLTILIYFWEESVQEHEALFQERLTYRMMLLGILAVLIAVDGCAELFMRRRRGPVAP